MEMAGPTMQLACADAGTVAKNAWIAAGRSSSTFQMTYGCQYGYGGGPTAAIKSMVEQYSMPAGWMSVAPYLTIPRGQSTITKAWSGAGDVFNSPAGNWPADACNDFWRTWAFYDPTIWNQWASQINNAPPGCPTVTYEGSTQLLADVWQGTFVANSIQNGNWLVEDMINHPSFADVAHCFFLGCQQGDPTTPNSGCVVETYFTVWSCVNVVNNANNMNIPSSYFAEIGGGGIWRLAQSPYQVTGAGTGNSYNTPQGGALGSNATHPYGYSQVNQAPGVLALVDWNAATGALGG